MTGALEISPINRNEIVLAVALSTDGGYFATAGVDATARLWAVNTGQEVLCVNHEDIILAIAFSSDGHYFATAGEDATTQVWEVETGRRVACLVHEASVHDVAFSLGRNCVVTATGSQLFPQSVHTTSTITVWDVTTAQKIMYVTHKCGVSACAFSPTGKYIAIASLDGVIGIWATDESRQCIARFPSEQVDSHISVFSNRENLTDMSLVGNTPVWQANSSFAIMNIIPEYPVMKVAFSPNARYLATVGFDSVQVWEVTSGLRIAHLTHKQKVNAVAFSMDGKYLATASDDQTARVLDVSGSREIACLTFEDKVNAITFSSSGKLLATATGDLMSGRQDVGVRLWLWQPEDVVSGII